MHPEELEKLEDQDQNRNSYTDIQLTFASETGKSRPQVMVATCADVKTRCP
jgi:hypothetical protein